MSTDYLVEITGISDQTLAPITLCFSTLPTYMTGPSDSPPNRVYEPRLTAPGNYELHLWGSGATRGSSAATSGVIEVDNSDAALDACKNWGFDGQSVVLRRCPPDGVGCYPADFPVIAAMTASVVDFTWSKMRVSIRDINQMTGVLPFQPTTYLGNNSLPNGVEGVATDLQYKCKPVLLGKVNNIPAPCVNTSQLVYQVSDRTNYIAQAYTVTAVYDKGVSITTGTNRATLAALLSATPTAATYDWCDDATSGCYIKLGSSPAGMVTVDANEGTTAQRTLAQIMSRVLTGPAKVVSASIVGATALDAIAGGEVGLWVFTGSLDVQTGQVSTTTIGSLLDSLAATANAYWINLRDGTWAIGALAAPTGPAKAQISTWLITDASGVTIDAGDQALVDSTISTNSPVPIVPWTILLAYDQLPQTQTVTDLAASVAQARIAYVRQQYRVALAVDATVKALHANAPTLNYTSCFVNVTDAAAEAARQLAMRKVRRDLIEVPLDPSVPLLPPSTRLSGDPFTLTPTDLNRGDLIELKLGRFDWDKKLFVIIGYVEDLGGPSMPAKTTLILWG